MIVLEYLDIFLTLRKVAILENSQGVSKNHQLFDVISNLKINLAIIKQIPKELKPD